MASTGEAWRLGRRPALDGLRGLAVLLVVAGHSWDPLIAAGSAGVSAFFVLSGFLITALLLEEQDRDGAVSLSGFYARRARRLFPALAVFLVVMAAASTVYGDGRYGTCANLLAVALYVGNWIAMTTSLDALGHTWSLAVEEQFYIAFPLVIIAFRRSPRTLGAVLAAGIVGSMVVRLSLWSGGLATESYYRTDANAAALLLGCLIALALRQRPMRFAPRWFIPVGLGVILVLSMAGRSSSWLMVPTLAPLAAAAIVYAIATGVHSKWLTWHPLTLVGHRSYALYLWHYPLLWVLREDLGVSHWLSTPFLIAAAWGLALLSWRWVESPALRFGRSSAQRDGRAVHGAADVAGPTHRPVERVAARPGLGVDR